MLVMSAYGQIEQFGSKALSGKSTNNNTHYFSSLQHATSINLNDTIVFKKVPQSDQAFKSIDSTENQILKLNISIYGEQKKLDSLKSKQGEAENSELRASLKKMEEESRTVIKNLNMLLEQALADATKFKSGRDLYFEKYIDKFKELLTTNLANANSTLDSITPRILMSSNILDSIKVEDMASLKNDEHFNKEAFAKKLFYWRWRIGQTTEINKSVDKIMMFIEHDLTKRSSDNGLDSLAKKLDSLSTVINSSYKLVDELNAFVKTYNIQKNKNKNDQFQLGAQPDVLTNFAGSNVLNVVPNIDIIGSYYYDDGSTGVTANVRLFSGYANTDSSVHRNASSFWLPEASLFGISFDVLGVFIPATKITKNTGTKRLGLRFTPSFLIKNTPERNASGEFTGTGNGVGIIHVRTGLEYYPIRFLVLYANFNCITPISQVQTFRNFYGTTKSLYPFFDFGFRTPIIISNKENKNTTINIDVNFIGISGDMKAVYPTNDVIIPSIRLGIVQRFNTGD